MPPQKIVLADKAAHIQAPWTPGIVGALNGQLVKLARTQGAFVWHAHQDEDELFLVLEGELNIHFEDGSLCLRPGELCVVPRGVRHQPEGEALILLFEPASTRNTGEQDAAFTVEAEALTML